jgi:histidine triad (HIT) family protein
MNSSCVFCRIVAGQLPSVRVYEDEHTLAFMDIGPVVKGHALVIPREHYDPITETPDDVLARTIAVVKAVARAQMTGLKADGVNVTQANGRVAGQEVPHLHFHVIPRFTDDHHSWNWKQKKYDTPTEIEAFACRIRSAVRQEIP